MKTLINLKNPNFQFQNIFVFIILKNILWGICQCLELFLVVIGHKGGYLHPPLYREVRNVIEYSTIYGKIPHSNNIVQNVKCSELQNPLTLHGLRRNPQTTQAVGNYQSLQGEFPFFSIPGC